MDLVLVSWCFRHNRENRTLLSACDPESSHGEDSYLPRKATCRVCCSKSSSQKSQNRRSSSNSKLKTLRLGKRTLNLCLRHLFSPAFSFDAGVYGYICDPRTPARSFASPQHVRLKPDASVLIIPKQPVVRFDLIFVMKLSTRRL